MEVISSRLVRKLTERQNNLCKSKATVRHPLKLNATNKVESPTLPQHAITFPFVEMCYLDDVRPDIKFATFFLTVQTYHRFPRNKLTSLSTFLIEFDALWTTN